MKYMTDANVSGLAKELRAKGIDCDMVHKLMLGNEDSRIPISDPEIVKFLADSKGTITLITLTRSLRRTAPRSESPALGCRTSSSNT